MPNLENNVLEEICILFTVITPLEVDSILFITIPLGFIIAEIPLLDERNIFFPSSIALKIDFEKCWCGPIELPNHPSSEILTITS